MTMPRIFLTGFPGFLATRLLPHVLMGPGKRGAEEGPGRAVCLVEPRMAGTARRVRASLEGHHPSLAGRIELLEGDLTLPGILAAGVGLGPVSRAYHLAAAYSLDVGREVAMAVNVRGTRNLLLLLEGQPELQSVHHVSTCYVSGRHPGHFGEDDLDVGQRFNNHYEESKFLAEIEVRNARDRGLPVTIYRPAVVTGDSRTGAADKLDGLYYLLQWIGAQGRIAIFPRVPGEKDAVFNVVPSDFAVRALARLSELDETVGRTLHLADPAPLPVGQVTRVAAQVLGKRIVRVPTPTSVAKAAMVLAGLLPGFPRIPSQSLDYLSHPTRYGTAATTPFLERVGLRVPALPSYLPALAGFLRDGQRASPSYAEPVPGGLPPEVEEEEGPRHV